MDIKSLKIFLQVCEQGSLTKAAISLGVTQPTLSRAIANLEEEFGGTLFYRTGRGLALTDLGEAALPMARSLVAHADEVMIDLRERGRSPSGIVTLGVLPSMVQPLTVRLYELVREQYPGIRLRVAEGFSDQIEQWLASGDVDIGLLSRYRATRPHQDEILLNSSLLLIGPADAQLSSDGIEFERLAAFPLVLPAVPNGLRLLIDETASRQGIKLNIVLEADSLGTQKDVIERCGCYSVLSPQAVFAECRAGRLSASPIVNPVLNRQAILTHTTHRPLSRSGRVVMKLMHQVIEDFRSQMGW